MQLRDSHDQIKESLNINDAAYSGLNSECSPGVTFDFFQSSIENSRPSLESDSTLLKLSQCSLPNLYNAF